MGRAFTFYIYNFTILFSLIILVGGGGGPIQKNTNASLKFFENRRKNRHKTRRRQFIFVTYLKLAPYIDTKTSILGVNHHV